jgi:hypothetical protein
MAVAHVVLLVALIPSALLDVLLHELKFQVFVFFVDVCQMGKARPTGETIDLPHWVGHRGDEGGTHYWTVAANEIGG